MNANDFVSLGLSEGDYVRLVIEARVTELPEVFETPNTWGYISVENVYSDHQDYIYIENIVSAEKIERLLPKEEPDGSIVSAGEHVMMRQGDVWLLMGSGFRYEWDDDHLPASFYENLDDYRVVRMGWDGD